jgi:hypothetical protein
MIGRRRTLLALVLCGLAATASLAQASTSSHHKPLLKAVTYKQLTTIGSDGFLQGRFTATVRLYAHAPSVGLRIKGITNAEDLQVTFRKSYGPGVHHLSTVNVSMPVNSKYKVSLFVNEPKDRGLHSSNHLTLFVNSAGVGNAG